MVADTFLIVLIVRCLKKKPVYFLFFHSYDFVTVFPLSSKTNNCYNITICYPHNVFVVLWNLMISWIVFILQRTIFPIHSTYIYSLVSYWFIKQDQMILTCNYAVASLMLSRFLYFEDMNDIDKSQTSDITFNNDLQNC
jgi:hypothetical protein